ncbi:MAG: anti-sigma factor [Parafilimonas sp.]|nr:anti-sigma factor [Parafilimonas sp.]
MDIKGYIQSGIIEQYVLGLTSAEESAEFEQLRAQYPELNDAVLNFEKQLEEYALINAIQPPLQVRSTLEKELFNNSTTEKTSIKASTPVYNINTWRYVAAACIILLIISTALNFYFYSGYKNSKDQFEALLSQQNTLQANNASYKQSLQMMEDTSMMHVEMKSVPGKEKNLATVLWDKSSKDVYLYINNMQPTPQGKQYQLWAIVDGKPVDAGMISDCVGLCKMKKIDHAEAFAVTLEKEGGSATPTMNEMYVMGKI